MRVYEMNSSLQRTKPLFSKLFSTANTHNTYTNTNTNIISYYFSLLNSSPNHSHLRHLHARLLRTNLYDSVFLSSKLVLMYSKHNKLISHSLPVFFHMPQRNNFSWNILIGEFSRSKFPERSIQLFHQMWTKSDIRPDEFTVPLVLKACAGSGDVKLGVNLHGLCVKIGLDRSLFVVSALVFMYITFGKILNARVLFDEIPERDYVLWTTMLAGYAQHGEPMLGLEVFREMIGSGIELDGVVMVSLLLVCGQLGWLKHGKSVHGWCVRRCVGLEFITLGNAIIDMYVKCATLTYARRVFDKMSEKDVISWSSLILGYGLSGCVTTALELFDQMVKRERSVKVKPNGVTFLGVLCACAHGGLVERARMYFKMMRDFKVVAELKHYASMVDCLARAGLLDEAERFIGEMPMEPDAAVLGAVLSGCLVHSNVEVGERTAKKLIRLEPEKPGYYVLLSNIYAAGGRFDEAERVRIFMKERKVSKIPAYSLIESNTSILLPLT